LPQLDDPFRSGRQIREKDPPVPTDHEDWFWDRVDDGLNEG
jgi:hypothetical protein